MKPTSGLPANILKSLQKSDPTGIFPGSVKPRRQIDHNDQSRNQVLARHLISGLANDFNNLLTVIAAGHRQVASYSSDPRIGRVLEINTPAIDKSRKITAQLLAFSGKQKLQPAAANINDTISLFEALIERAIGNRRVQWNLAAGLPSVFVDRAQLQSALLNLIGNARDAAPHNGSITIFTETKMLTSSSLTAVDLPAGQYVVLGVSDTGGGMSAETYRRAIDPFFSTKGAAGLGLSQCHGFARQSGGTLVIESAKGGGTTASIILPALGGGEKLPNAPSHRTVLLVDGEFAIRSLVAEMLRGQGNTVLEAEDPPDALQQLLTNASIDYLFTDIIMPGGINGLDSIETSKTRRAGLPALLASGYASDVLRKIAQLQNDVLVEQNRHGACTLGL